MNMLIDTIVAPATPSGAGGIAIVRLSGPKALAILASLHSRGPLALSKPRELVLGRIVIDGEPIDQGLAVSMPGPASYTGEDVAELQLHAGPAIVRLIIEATLTQGARLAEPGEFTKRAYLNGKLDLAQAEAVADLISSEGQAAAKLAGSQLAGKLSEQISSVRGRIVAEIAGLSANLDFSEEDIPDISRASLIERLHEIDAVLSGWLAESSHGAIIKNGLRVAIIGLPNAGKSSLLNALVGYDRAIVTDIAGTTRDIIAEQIEIDGLMVYLSDTAGLTTTTDQVEEIGIERAWQTAHEADLILLTGSSNQDLGKLQTKKLPRVPIIGVQTKLDIEPHSITWPVKIEQTIETSAAIGSGLIELRRAIYQTALGTVTSQLPLLANLRHVEAIREGQTDLRSAIRAAEAHQPLDIVAGELTLAADHITTILGENVSTEIINAIFSKFCIGK